MDLNGASILLCATGGVAIYKAVGLASRLAQRGAMVDVVMTRAAKRFVTPLMFSAVTLRDVYCNPWREGGRGPEHIALAERPDLAVVAPATANTLAKIAHGIADNLLTSVLLATRKPVLLAPAMNAGMWEAPATRENMETLAGRGYRIVGPDSGRLACGHVGWGRMAEPDAILAAIEQCLGEARAGAPENRV